MDFSTLLGIDVDTRDLLRGDAALDRLASTGEQTEARMSRSMHDISGSMTRAANTMGNATERMSRQGRQSVTNLTYQLGDVAQMTAAGQNPFMLMMQQGEQAAGAMRELQRQGGAMRGLGAAIRQLVNPITLATFAFIGLGSWAVQSLVKARGGAEKLEDQVKDLGTAFKDFQGFAEIAMADADKLGEKYGSAAERARELGAAQAENQRMSVANQMDQFFANQSNPLGFEVLKGLATTKIADSFGLERPFIVLNEAAREARDAVDALATDFMRASGAMASAEGFEEQAAAAERMLSVYTLLADADGNRSESEQEYIDALSSALDILYQQLGAEERLAESVQERATASQRAYAQYFHTRRAGAALAAREELEQIKRVYDAHQEYYQSRVAGAASDRAMNARNVESLNAQNALQQRQLEILQSYNSEGEKTAATKQLEIDLAAEQLQSTLMLEAAANGVTQAERESIEAAVELLREIMATENALADASSGASRLKDLLANSSVEAQRLAANLRAASSALASAVNAAANLDVSSVGLEAQNRALEAGNSLVQARVQGLIEAKRAELSGAFGSEDAAIRVAAAQAMQEYTAAVQRNADAQAQNDELTDALADGTKGASKAAKEAAKELKKLQEEIKQLEWDADPVKRYVDEVDRLQTLADAGLSDGALAKAIAEAKDELSASLPVVNLFTDAFEDAFNGTIKSFDEFASSIMSGLKNLLAQMAAMAIRNQILIPMATSMMGGGVGATGSAIGGQILGSAMGVGGGASAAGAGALGGVGAMASTIGTGLSTGFMSSVYGGFTGMSGAVAGGLGMGGAAGIATAIGAVAAPVLAVYAAFKFFQKKTKVLDEGITAAITESETLVSSFRKTKTTRFFGLSSKTSTNKTAASEEIASPIQEAVRDVQDSILKAASSFGFGAEEFEGFAYKMKVSLKGLNEDQAARAVAEEMAKMGDAFTQLLPHFESMNELLAAAEQRYGIENRLLSLQGRELEVLARERAREMEATHEMNKPLLAQVHALEAQAAAARVANEQLNKLLQNGNMFETRADMVFAATRAFANINSFMNADAGIAPAVEATTQQDAQEEASVQRETLGVLGKLFNFTENNGVNQSRILTRILRLQERQAQSETL